MLANSTLITVTLLLADTVSAASIGFWVVPEVVFVGDAPELSAKGESVVLNSSTTVAQWAEVEQATVQTVGPMLVAPLVLLKLYQISVEPVAVFKWGPRVNVPPALQQVVTVALLALTA